MRISTAVRRMVVAVATSMALAVMMGGTEARATGHPAESNETLGQPYSDPDADCFYCGSGPEHGCAVGQHYDSKHIGPSNYRYEAHPGCTLSLDQDFPCGEHSACNAARQEVLQTAELMVKRNDQRGLGKLIAENTATLRVDLTKRQILVIGCDGTVLTHLDLTESQLLALGTPSAIN